MMFEDPVLQSYAEKLLTGGIFFIVFLLFFCILRSIKGPRIADRILSINMIGTMVITAIIFIAGLKDLGSLVDIGLLYAMISFLAVIVLSRIYRGEYLARKEAKMGKSTEETELQATEEGLRFDGDD